MEKSWPPTLMCFLQKGTFIFFVLNWKLGKMLCQPKHVSFMLVFQIGPLQKILIIIACGCWIQTYTEMLVQSIQIIITYIVFNEQQLNNELTCVLKHDYFFRISLINNILSNTCKNDLSNANKKNLKNNRQKANTILYNFCFYFKMKF